MGGALHSHIRSFQAINPVRRVEVLKDFSGKAAKARLLHPVACLMKASAGNMSNRQSTGKSDGRPGLSVRTNLSAHAGNPKFSHHCSRAPVVPSLFAIKLMPFRVLSLFLEGGNRKENVAPCLKKVQKVAKAEALPFSDVPFPFLQPISADNRRRVGRKKCSLPLYLLPLP